MATPAVIRYTSALFYYLGTTPSVTDTRCESIDPEATVALDLGVLNFVHDSNGVSVERLDLSSDRERLEREQRSLSRNEHESNNWETQRQSVAQVHADMRNKNHDFKH